MDLGAAAEFYNVDVIAARRFICAVLVAVAATAAGAQQTVPPPKPFPGATPPTGKPIEPPATPATPGAQSAPAPPSGPYGPAKSGCDAAAIGAPVYPGAQYVDSFDAGKGQRFCLFGTDAGYADIVEYYKRTMKGGNREIFRTPGVWQFDVGRFAEETMAYAPGVLVKDYAASGGTGYLVMRGAQEKRYKTIIQIVPPSGPVRLP